MENSFSPRGTQVCSYSHCHPHTAFTFWLQVFQKPNPIFLRISHFLFRLVLHAGHDSLLTKEYKKDAHTAKLPCNIVFTDHLAFTYLPPHFTEVSISKIVQSLNCSSQIRHHFECGFADKDFCLATANSKNLGTTILTILIVSLHWGRPVYCLKKLILFKNNPAKKE